MKLKQTMIAVIELYAVCCTVCMLHKLGYDCFHVDSCILLVIANQFVVHLVSPLMPCDLDIRDICCSTTPIQ